MGCGGGDDITATFGVAGLGERRRLDGTTAGHPIHHMFPASLELHYFPVTFFTQTSAVPGILRCLRGSSGAGLRQKCTEGKYVVEGDLLEVPGPAKRRRSPRPATPNVAVLWE